VPISAWRQHSDASNAFELSSRGDARRLCENTLAAAASDIRRANLGTQLDQWTEATATMDPDQGPIGSPLRSHIGPGEAEFEPVG